MWWQQIPPKQKYQSCRLSHTHSLTHTLTPWSGVLHVKPTGSQLVKKFPSFLEPKRSLQRLQVPATSFYPEPDQSSPCPPFHFLRNIILPSKPGSCKWFLSLGFPHLHPIRNALLPCTKRIQMSRIHYGLAKPKDYSLNFRTRFKYSWMELSLYRYHSVNMYYTRVKLVFTYRSVQD